MIKLSYSAIRMALDTLNKCQQIINHPNADNIDIHNAKCMIKETNQILASAGILFA